MVNTRDKKATYEAKAFVQAELDRILRAVWRIAAQRHGGCRTPNDDNRPGIQTLTELTIHTALLVVQRPSHH